MPDKLKEKANKPSYRQRFGKIELYEESPGLWKPKNPAPRTKMVEVKPGTWVPEDRVDKHLGRVAQQTSFPKVN
jgi:hypothetical protein